MQFKQRRQPEGEKWQQWIELARAGLASLKAAVERGEDPIPDASIYKGALPFLWELSEGKCAYCEVLIATQPPDVEHYRPKSRLHPDDDVGGVPPHSGYWWLSYEWSNLLLSCTDCNRRRKHRNGVFAGKADRFPIRGSRARRPQDRLEEEDPLLLKPFDPLATFEQHFDFVDGGLRAKTEQAQVTLNLLKLNERELLVVLRNDKIRLAEATLQSILQAIITRASIKQSDIDEINAMWEGNGQFGTFTRIALGRKVDEFRREGLPVTFPLPARLAR